MCMRKVFEEEEFTGEVFLIPHDASEHLFKHDEKLTKAKDHYIRQHNEMLLREAEKSRENETPESPMVSEITDDLLAKSTAYYRLAINSISRLYSNWKQSKAYK